MSNRTMLKSYFVTNARPTAAQFADLIDSGLNPAEDSIKKLSAGPVAIEAQPDKSGVREVLHFYKDFNKSEIGWKINLNTRMNGLDIADAGMSRLFIKETDGNVGIGTISPQARLQVSGGNMMVDGKIGIGVSPNYPLSFPDALGQKITLWGQGTTAYGFGIAPSALQIHTDGPGGDVLFGHGSSAKFTETMRVKGNGNVGIGTAAPRAKLEVMGGAIIPAIGNNTNAGILFSSDPAGGGGDVAWIRYQALNYDTNGVSVKDDKSVLEIGVGNDGDDHIALMPSGNVGIGIRNPSAQLHLSGGNLFVDKGRIGIGTATPGSQLSNTDKNTIGTDGNGGNPGSLAWAAVQAGYVGLFYNGGSASNSNGLVVKVASNTATAFDVSTGPQESASPSIFTIKGNGNVGIGTNNPQVRLHVVGSVPQNYSNVLYGYLNKDAPTGKNTPGPNMVPVSILASDRIVALEFNALSDHRIKKNLLHNDPQQSLKTINQIRITDYLYKDEIQHGSTIQKGVIAQELETIIPEAVSRHSDFLPDIYSMPQSATLSNTDLIITMPQPHQLQTDDMVRLITAAGNKEVMITVTSDDTFTVSDWNGAATEIFVYGKQVADFRTVNYNSIFCLGISAIQAMYKQVQQLKEEMKGLKEKLSAAFVPAL